MYADQVRCLKRAPESYYKAARALGIGPSNLHLVAAHAWDVIGAMRAGCAAAFVARSGVVLDPLAQKPAVIGKDLRQVMDRIIEIELG